VDLLDGLVQGIQTFIDAGLGAIESTITLMQTMIDEVSLSISFLTDAPGDTLDRVRRSLGPLQDFADSLQDIHDQGRFIFEGEYAESLEKQWDDLGTAVRKTILDFEQVGHTNQRLDPTDREVIAASADQVAGSADDKSSDYSQDTTIYSKEDGDTTEEDSHGGGTGDRRWQRPVYNYYITIVQGQTLSDIAEIYYGDRQKVAALAELNDLATSELEAGQRIRVPLAQEDSPLYNNMVFDRKGDQYGRDMAFDHNGFIKPSATGALAVTTGINTLKQTLQNRLKFTTGDLRSNKSFGFPSEATIGMPATSNAIDLIAARVRATIEGDPRVTEFVPTEVRTDKDTIWVSGTAVLAEGLTDNMTFYVK
jgi:LysM repeat protein